MSIPAAGSMGFRPSKPQPPRAPLDFFDRTGELAQVEQLITQGKPVATFTSIWRLEAPGTWRIVFDKGNDVCDCAKP